jgi:hypothetical protein
MFLGNYESPRLSVPRGRSQTRRIYELIDYTLGDFLLFVRSYASSVFDGVYNFHAGHSYSKTLFGAVKTVSLQALSLAKKS